MIAFGLCASLLSSRSLPQRRANNNNKQKKQGDAADVLWMSVSLTVLVLLSAQLYRLYAYALLYAEHAAAI